MNLSLVLMDGSTPSGVFICHPIPVETPPYKVLRRFKEIKEFFDGEVQDKVKAVKSKRKKVSIKETYWKVSYPVWCSKRIVGEIKTFARVKGAWAYCGVEEVKKKFSAYQFTMLCTLTEEEYKAEFEKAQKAMSSEEGMKERNSREIN